MNQERILVISMVRVSILVSLLAGCNHAVLIHEGDEVSVEQVDEMYQILLDKLGVASEVETPPMNIYFTRCKIPEYKDIAGCTKAFVLEPYLVYAETCNVLFHELLHVVYHDIYGTMDPDHTRPLWQWVHSNYQRQICKEFKEDN